MLGLGILLSRARTGLQTLEAFNLQEPLLKVANLAADSLRFLHDHVDFIFLALKNLPALYFLLPVEKKADESLLVDAG